MKTNRLPALLLALGLFSACASSPAVTTPEERAQLNEAVSLLEAGVLAWGLEHPDRSADTTTALAQVAELRALVAASETTPVSFADVRQRIVNFGLAWLAKKNAG